MGWIRGLKEGEREARSRGESAGAGAGRLGRAGPGRAAVGRWADAGFSPSAGDLLADHPGLARARQLPAGR